MGSGAKQNTPTSHIQYYDKRNTKTTRYERIIRDKDPACNINCCRDMGYSAAVISLGDTAFIAFSE